MTMVVANAETELSKFVSLIRGFEEPAHSFNHKKATIHFVQYNEGRETQDETA